MSVGITIFIVVMAVIIITSYFSPAEQHVRAKFRHLAEVRPKRSNEEYCDTFFANSTVTPKIVAEIRRLFDDQFGLDLRGLEPDDDLSKDYSIIWEMDSMADVEIVVALEREFNIVITDAEATELRSVRMIAELVADKLDKRKIKSANKSEQATPRKPSD